MKESDKKRIGKFLSLILRHSPQTIGLELDENGWADVHELIRANQGHSINIELGLFPTEPPEYLYHGTATHFLSSIIEKGILQGNRQYVHLSKDKETAVKVGSRHGKPVVLTIMSGEMYRNGVLFYCSDNNVWLTNYVDVKYISKI